MAYDGDTNYHVTYTGSDFITTPVTVKPIENGWLVEHGALQYAATTWPDLTALLKKLLK